MTAVTKFKNKQGSIQMVPGHPVEEESHLVTSASATGFSGGACKSRLFAH
jgi:hypothetical protein